MTAHELAHKLLDGPDLMVTTRGYEGGVNEICTISRSRPLHKNVNLGRPYYGDHEYCSEDDDCYYWLCQENNDRVLAIHLDAEKLDAEKE